MKNFETLEKEYNYHLSNQSLDDRLNYNLYYEDYLQEKYDETFLLYYIILMTNNEYIEIPTTLHIISGIIPKHYDITKYNVEVIE